MARLPRIKAPKNQAGVYHVRTRVAGDPGWYPLQKAAAQRRFFELLRLYLSCYGCELIGWVLMGNHYHLILRFEPFRKLSREELYERARRLYRNPHKVLKTEKQWLRFNRRLFDVSEFGRNLNSEFARWYNRRYHRRGSFWGGRFKSSLCMDQDAVTECLLYIELNPIRARLVQRPEQWHYSSAFFRMSGQDQWMKPLAEIFHMDPSQVFSCYRRELYERGAVASKQKQGTIPAEILLQERKQGFVSRGLYTRRLRFFTDGLMIGSREMIQDQVDRFRRQGRYLRRRYPIGQLGGQFFTLREQRRQLCPQVP